MKIGDRVRVNGEMLDKEFNNQSGIIIDLHFTTKIGIKFDSYIDGHSCNGRGKSGHCWYVNADYVIIESDIKDFKEELDKITL